MRNDRLPRTTRYQIFQSLTLRRVVPFTMLSAVPLLLAFSSAGKTPDKAVRPGKPDVAAAKKSKLTYSGSVAAILQTNCVTCHRPGEVAPFSLTGYDDAKKRAKQIALVAKSHFMPPWKADSHGEFVDERRLTDDQIATLEGWANDGAPVGDPKAVPPLPKYPVGWHMGPPDKVIGLPEPYTLKAEGKDVYRCFVIPTDGDVDKYIAAVEVHPGNRQIVHHVIAYLDTTGAGRKLDAAEPGPGYTSSGGGPGFTPGGFLGGWAPGNETKRLPDGIGNALPKGSDIVLEVHYHPSGKVETDKTEVGLYYTTAPVHKRIYMLPIINPFFQIPAGAKDHLVKAVMPSFRNMTVLGVTPHMHLLGRSMRVWATLPDKTEKPIINVPDWDFNWQMTYGYKAPMKFPAGTKFELEARYDNSPANPRNPNKSPRAVGWGEQTTDEMCIAFLGYTRDDEDLLKK